MSKNLAYSAINSIFVDIFQVFTDLEFLQISRVLNSRLITVLKTTAKAETDVIFIFKDFFFLSFVSSQQSLKI